MNKTELVEAIAKKADLSKKDAETALKAFTDTVGAQLRKSDIIEDLMPWSDRMQATCRADRKKQ